MLEYKKIMVDRAVVIELTNDLELVVKKRKSRRSILKVLKGIFTVETFDSQNKNSALNDTHDRITFK